MTPPQLQARRVGIDTQRGLLRKKLADPAGMGDPPYRSRAQGAADSLSRQGARGWLVSL